MPADRVTLGRAVVTRVVEWQWEVGTSIFAQTPPEAWHDNADLLVPSFLDADEQLWRVAMQTWVIHVDGLTVAVDTGVGNGRHRPHMPPLSDLQTNYLQEVPPARRAGGERSDRGMYPTGPGCRHSRTRAT